MRAPASAGLSRIVAGPLTATILALSGCGSSGGGPEGTPDPGPPVSVSVSPASQTVTIGTLQQFTATVQNDPNNRGVQWTLSGGGCAGTECGTLDNFTANPVTYFPPNQLPSPPTVTLTATAFADTTKSAAATITLDQQIVVSVFPETLTIALGDTREYQASVLNDVNGIGVTWSITGCPAGVPCGSFSPATTPLGTPTRYTAPTRTG